MTQQDRNAIINVMDYIINIYMNNKIEDVEIAIIHEYVEETLCGHERRS